VLLDGLGRIVGFTGKANGETKEVHVRTKNPARDYTIAFSGESVSLAATAHSSAPDVELPAEAFIRLVYGRLDAENTPSDSNNDALDGLKTAFPGL
jgi:hypothetical protein